MSMAGCIIMVQFVAIAFGRHCGTPQKTGGIAAILVKNIMNGADGR
jgi:hypothetical protein